MKCGVFLPRKRWRIPCRLPESASRPSRIPPAAFDLPPSGPSPVAPELYGPLHHHSPRQMVRMSGHARERWMTKKVAVEKK